MKATPTRAVIATVAILGLLIGFGQIDIAQASAAGTKTSAQTTFTPRPAVRIAAGQNCQSEQGNCEVKCVSAGGGNAAMTKCFNKCQAEADACSK